MMFCFPVEWRASFTAFSTASDPLLDNIQGTKASDFTAAIAKTMQMQHISLRGREKERVETLWHQGQQAVRELQHRLVVANVHLRVHQRSSLVLHGLHDAWVAMPDARDGDATRQIEQFAVVGRPDPASFAFLHDQFGHASDAACEVLLAHCRLRVRFALGELGGVCALGCALERKLGYVAVSISPRSAYPVIVSILQSADPVKKEQTFPSISFSILFILHTCIQPYSSSCLFILTDHLDCDPY